MENILVKPRNKKQSNIIKSFFKEMNIPFENEEKESLDAKIFRLYKEGHYDDEELTWFFETPKEYRVDPFELSPSGDIYWADKRRVENFEKNLEKGRIEKNRGELVKINVEEL